MPKRSRRRHSRHVNHDHKPQIHSDGLLYDILEEVENPFFLVLDNIQDPHNLGACIRTANAVGAHAVVAPRDRTVTLNATVVRVASGAAEYTPFVQVTNLARTLRFFKENDIHVVGTSDAAEKSIYETQLVGPLALVFGAEGDGMRRLTTETCDELVTIPMFGAVGCLNVSVAGVCLFEARRQRGLDIPIVRRPVLKLKSKANSE